MAAAYQTLGYLESGITEPLNRFAEKMLDFSSLLKHTVSYVLRFAQPKHAGAEADYVRTLQQQNPYYIPRSRYLRTQRLIAAS